MSTLPRIALLTACLAALLAHGAAADSLNKCIDAQGKITYSNLPCRNAREARKLEIDPAPLPDPAPAKSRVRAAKPVPAPLPDNAGAEREQTPATLKLETRRGGDKPVTRPSASKCDALADKLGSVFDKMDAARRKGYTQEQMDGWNQQVKDLERQKQQAGCF